MLQTYYIKCLAGDVGDTRVTINGTPKEAFSLMPQSEPVEWHFQFQWTCIHTDWSTEPPTETSTEPLMVYDPGPPMILLNETGGAFGLLAAVILAWGLNRFRRSK